jgi:septum formation protein
LLISAFYRIRSFFSVHGDLGGEPSSHTIFAMTRLILASASPRRSELLRNAGISFEVDPAHIREEPEPGEKPLDYARRLARDKAVAVLARYRDALVLGADTVVVVDEHLLEKPANAEDAARMLRLLSGRAHQVITGVCLAGPGFERVEAEVTQVVFGEMSDQEIAAYVACGEPMDKAGAYGIQGLASRWVERIEGCYFNVVGLPVSRVYRLLRQMR